MRAIIIGAGRGRRLMPTTADTPKCYAEVQGRRLLDWALAAFAEAGVTDICFIGGYQIDKVRADYPQFTFRHNAGWEHNNILLSLMHAEDLMDDGFVCCYSDILFTSDVDAARPAASRRHRAERGHALARRYAASHPASAGRRGEGHGAATACVTRVHRAHHAARGAWRIHRHREVHRRRARRGCASTFIARAQKFAGKPFREAAVFEKAYLIHAASRR